jgi:outer membrane protein assembly factor BamB
VKTSRTLTALLALLLLVPVPAPAVAAEWTQLGADAGHSYHQPDEALIGVTSVRSLSRAWRTDVVPPRLEEIPGGPAIRDGIVYVTAFGRVIEGAARTRLYALDLETGAVRWSTKLPGVSRWTPTVEGEVVIVPVEGPDLPLGLYAVDASTGERRWFRRLSCRVCDPRRTETWQVVSADGVAIAAMGGNFVGGRYRPYGRLAAFDATDGARLWKRRMRNPGMPVVVDGAVIVGEESLEMNADERLWALELRSGEERWRRRKGIAWFIALSAAGDEVFAATGPRLLSLSTVDGSTRWKLARGVDLGTPVIGPRSLFIERPDGRDRRFGSSLVALDRSTGAVRWSVPDDALGYSLWTGQLLVNGVLIVGGRYEFGDRPAGRPPTDDGFAISAWGGRVLDRLPRGLSGLEADDVAIADGFLVLVRGTVVTAYTVAPEE